MSKVRLQDREHRTGRSFFRKKVFYVSTKAGKRIHIEFHKNYQKIYDNYIKAYSLVPDEFVGQLYASNNQDLKLEVQYLGTPLSNTPSNRKDMFRVIREIHSLSNYQGEYQPPRYLLEVDRRKNNEYKHLSTLIKVFSMHPIYISLGHGVEDPAVSNFVKDDNGVHLVDLDNFDTQYSLDSMLGFMLADSAIENVVTLSVEELLDEALMIKPDVNQGLFFCGMAGRISVLILDEAIEDAREVEHAGVLVEDLAERAYCLLYK